MRLAKIIIKKYLTIYLPRTAKIAAKILLCMFLGFTIICGSFFLLLHALSLIIGGKGALVLAIIITTIMLLAAVETVINEFNLK